MSNTISLNKACKKSETRDTRPVRKLILNEHKFNYEVQLRVKNSFVDLEYSTAQCVDEIKNASKTLTELSRIGLSNETTESISNQLVTALKALNATNKTLRQCNDALVLGDVS